MPRTSRRVLPTLADLDGLTVEEQTVLLAQHGVPPMMGGSDDDAGTSGGGDADDSSTDDASGKDDKDRAFAEMRRKARDAEKRAADAEKRLKEASDREAAEQGKWRELAEKRQKELDEAKAQAEQAVKAAAAKEREQLVERVAARLNFANPVTARRLVDVPEDADERTVETELKALAKAEPYLLKSTSTRTGREVGDVPTDDKGRPDLMAAMAAGVRQAIQAGGGRGRPTT
mgnify:CR=1 FL=1